MSGHATRRPISRVAWRRWIKPWYWAYAVLGATATGMVPILLPLAVYRLGTPAEAVRVLIMSFTALGIKLAAIERGTSSRHDNSV